MYWKHFGFRRAPFSGPGDPDRYFESESQQEGLARLQFLCDEQRRGAVVTGISGVGKTTLLDTFVRRVSNQNREIAVVTCPAFGARELFFELAQSLGLPVAPDSSEAELWRQLRQCVSGNRVQGTNTIFVIDQAELLLDRPDGLHALNALFQLDHHPAANYCVILAARPDAVARYRRELVELVDLAVILEPFSEAETGSYIQHCVRWGGVDRPLFAPDAVAAIHRICEGVPRRIGRLCDLALVAAAGEERDVITGELVEAVSDELNAADRVHELVARGEPSEVGGAGQNR